MILFACVLLATAEKKEEVWAKTQTGHLPLLFLLLESRVGAKIHWRKVNTMLNSVVLLRLYNRKNFSLKSLSRVLVRRGRSSAAGEEGQNRTTEAKHER